MSPVKRPTRRKGKADPAAKPAVPRPFIAHHLVPPHELLSEPESQATLKNLGTLAERLPKILIADPGLGTDPKFLKAREAKEPLAGRLVRIRRPSATAGEAVAYRVLIANTGD